MKHTSIVPTIASDSSPEVESRIDLRELGRKIWRRRGIIAGATIGGLALTYLVLLLLTPRYTASSFVMIDPRQEQVVNIESVMSGLSADSATIATEAEVLRSRSLAERVIARFNLDRDPEFNPAIGERDTAAGGDAQQSSSTTDEDEAQQNGGSAAGTPTPQNGNAAPAAQTGQNGSAQNGNANVASQAQQNGSAVVADQGQQANNAPAGDNAEQGGFAKTLQDWRQSIFGSDAEENLTPEERAQREHAQVVDTFLSKISIQPQALSRVIRISVTTRVPLKSAVLANALADTYVGSQLELKSQATSQATSWLTDRVEALRGEVRAKEQAVEAYRARSGLIQGANSTLASQQVSEVTTALVAAQADRTAADARLRQIQKLLTSPNGVESAAEVLGSPLIQSLKEQESALRQKIAEMSMEYGPRHPLLINAKAQLVDLERNIRAEVNKVVESLQSQAQVAHAREDSLKSNLEAMKTKVGQLNAAEVQLHALEREAAASRALLENFLSRSKETAEQQGIQQADARVISRADVPVSPSFPNKPQAMVFAFFVFAALGVGLAFAAEALENGLRSTTEVEEQLGVPALGLVPAVRSSRGSKNRPENFILDKPTSAFGEAIRSLRTALLLSRPDHPPRTILFTSSVPSEGKTSTTVSLGRMLASVGQSVIILDGDLRRPNVHRMLGGHRELGLVEWLAGEAELDQVIRKDERSDLHFIAAGMAIPNPTDVLGSERTRSLLELLASRYQYVLIDSSPVMAVSDTRVLSRLVDTTVFVVRWSETPREVARSGLRQIVDAGAPIAGVLLTLVDTRKHARYGYGDSSYYYGSVRKYYTS